MLLEHGEIAPHPGVADGVVERRQRLEHEPLQPLPHQQVRERVLQRRRIVAGEQREDLAVRPPGPPGSRRVAIRPSASAFSSSSVWRMILPGRRPTSISRLIARSLANFRDRISPLAVVVARRLRKAVTALPHPQDVLRQSGLALDRADVEGEASGFSGRVHRCEEEIRCSGWRIDTGAAPLSLVQDNCAHHQGMS